MQARRGDARRAGIGLALITVVVAAGACASSASGNAPARSATEHWVRSAGGGISVSHPASWRASTFVEHGSFVTGLLFLSNQEVASPCITSDAGMHVSCTGLPRTTLQPRRLVIAWLSTATPPDTSVIAYAPGRSTRIAGYRAKIATTGATGTCKADGGTTAIVATIASGPEANNGLEMLACLSHPSAEQRRQILRSLRTVRL